MENKLFFKYFVIETNTLCYNLCYKKVCIEIKLTSIESSLYRHWSSKKWRY